MDSIGSQVTLASWVALIGSMFTSIIQNHRRNFRVAVEKPGL